MDYFERSSIQPVFTPRMGILTYHSFLWEKIMNKIYSQINGLLKASRPSHPPKTLHFKLNSLRQSDKISTRQSQKCISSTPNFILNSYQKAARKIALSKLNFLTLFFFFGRCSMLTTRKELHVFILYRRNMLLYSIIQLLCLFLRGV